MNKSNLPFLMFLPFYILGIAAASTLILVLIIFFLLIDGANTLLHSLKKRMP